MGDKAWDKLDSETDKAFHAFTLYRDMGPNRSLQKVHDEIYGTDVNNMTHIKRWSRNHDWLHRVEQFDQHVDNKARKEVIDQQVEDRKQMYNRQKKISQGAQQVLAKWIGWFNELDPHELDAKFKDASFSEISILMKRAMEKEREAFEEPGTIEEKRQEGGLLGVLEEVHDEMEDDLTDGDSPE